MDVKQLAARLARECEFDSFGTGYECDHAQLETLVCRVIEEHEKASAEARAVAKIVFDCKYVGDRLVGKSHPQIFKLISDAELMTYEADTKLYTHPAGIDDIRRAAEAAGYMLCRWNGIARQFPDDARKSISGVEGYAATDYIEGLTAPKEQK